MTATKYVPKPAMMWYAKNSSGIFVGQVSRGKWSNPFTSAAVVAINQKTQQPIHKDGIVDALKLLIWLSNQYQRGADLSLE